MTKINRKTPFIDTAFIDNVESILDKSVEQMVKDNIYYIASSKGLKDKTLHYSKCSYYAAPLYTSDRRIFKNLFISYSVITSFFEGNFEDIKFELTLSTYPDYLNKK